MFIGALSVIFYQRYMHVIKHHETFSLYIFCRLILFDDRKGSSMVTTINTMDTETQVRQSHFMILMYADSFIHCQS